MLERNPDSNRLDKYPQNNRSLIEAREQLNTRQEEEKRLLYQWAETVKETGFCDYFPLEESLRNFHTIKQEPAKTIFIKDNIKADLDNLQLLSKEVVACIIYLENFIDRFITEYLVDQHLEKEIREEFNTKLRRLSPTLQFIFNICAKYDLISRDFSTLFYKSDYSTNSQTEIERSAADLNYYLQYFKEYLQPNKLSSELSLVDDIFLYFERLNFYLQRCSSTTESLVKLTTEELEQVMSKKGLS